MTEAVKGVAILIPSLNPDNLFTEYVKSLFEAGFEHILVVDDGSRDDCKIYFEQAKDMGAEIITHDRNYGKGHGLKTGFKYYLEHYGDMLCGVVTADADGQHSVSDTVKVAEKLAETGSFVLGCRDFSLDNVPPKSRFGNNSTIAATKLFFGKSIGDTQTGLRGISNDFAERCLKIPGERFEYEMAMLVDAFRENVPIVEVPIETIYINSNRETHFSPVKDSIKIYFVILRYFILFSLSGILSYLIDIGLFAAFSKLVFAGFATGQNIYWSTVVARVLSSLFNYNMNRKTVFADNTKVGQTIWKYYLLCAVQLLCSATIVYGVHQVLKIDTVIIKSVVDIVLFLVSYRIQHRWVFKSND
ncbi:MAG: bifunctional glycosyltransferase family 2/GtrA family protein [Acetatifactor sp.]|nr:bifunctional glycosyltransferase family 2/GtrA family protein [Acetatifactor sp.]